MLIESLALLGRQIAIDIIVEKFDQFATGHQLPVLMHFMPRGYEPFRKKSPA
jgi:hypothetical protein